MANFGKIMKRGVIISETKNKKGKYGRCDECDTMTLLYEYFDSKNEKWNFCENCIYYYTKEENP